MGRWLTLSGCRNVVALLVIVAAGVSVPTIVNAGGFQSADLSITKTDGVATARAGGIGDVHDHRRQRRARRRAPVRRSPTPSRQR